MSNKIRPCMGGLIRHSWEWIRNVDVTSYNTRGQVTGISLKGRYRCRHCYALKTGAFQMTQTEATQPQGDHP